MTLTATAASLERAYATARRRHQPSKTVARKRVLTIARILARENQSNGHHYSRKALNALRGRRTP